GVEPPGWPRTSRLSAGPSSNTARQYFITCHQPRWPRFACPLPPSSSSCSASVRPKRKMRPLESMRWPPKLVNSSIAVCAMRLPSGLAGFPAVASQVAWTVFQKAGARSPCASAGGANAIAATNAQTAIRMVPPQRAAWPRETHARRPRPRRCSGTGPAPATALRARPVDDGPLAAKLRRRFGLLQADQDEPPDDQGRRNHAGRPEGLLE